MRKVVGIAVGLVCAVSPTACSGSSVADDPPTSTIASSPSTTTPGTTAPTTAPIDKPQPPKLPVLATRESRAGAIAFVGYYIDVLNDAWVAESARHIRLESTGTCDVCQKLANLVDSVSERGGYQHGGLWSPTAVVAVPTQPVDKPILITKISIARGKWLKSAGARPKPIKEKQVSYDFYLAWRGSGWLVRDIRP